MLTEAEIKWLIDEDALSPKKRQAAVGQRYYEAEHDILNYRVFYYNTDGVLVEDKARSNSRICHPFFTEHVDQLTAFLLSFEENPIQAKPVAEGLQDHLDEYFDDEFWAEMGEVITGTTAKGFDYLYGYKNHTDRLAFQHADSLGVVEVRAKDTDDGCEYIIYWYVERIGKDRKLIKRIQIHDKDQIWFYIQEDDGKLLLDHNQLINPRPNIVWTDDKGAMYGDSLGFIPFWRLDYNTKQSSGLKPIKGLIDDYDMMECGLSNNVQDFDTPIHLIRGYDGDDLSELQQNIKTKKHIGVDDDGDVEVRTVDIPYQARQTKLDLDEKNIYRFGFGLNTAGLKDTAATTNVAIKSAYSLLDLKVNKLEIRLKQFMRKLLKVVLAEINTLNGTDYQQKDIYFSFEREIPVNEQENAQIQLTEAQRKQTEIGTLLNLATKLDDETIMQLVCEQLDIDYNDIKDKLPTQEEADPFMAQTALDAIQTEEPVGGDVIE